MVSNDRGSDLLYRIRLPVEIALSPDDSRFVSIVQRADSRVDRLVSEMYFGDCSSGGLEGSVATEPGCVKAPSWSPDGQSVAFLWGDIPAHGATTQTLGRWWPATREICSIAKIAVGASKPHWSPDGSRIAFSAPVFSAGAVPTIAQHDRCSVGDPDHEPVVVTEASYKSDGSGLRRGRRRQIFLVHLGTGKLEQITYGPEVTGFLCWAPDSSSIAYTVANNLERRARSAVALRLIEVSAGDGERCRSRQIGSPWSVAGSIVFTPDGTHLVVVGRLDESAGQRHLFRVSAAGTGVSDLTEEVDLNVLGGSLEEEPMAPRMLGHQPTPTLLFCARRRGGVALFRAALDGSEPVLHFAGGGRTSILAVATASRSNVRLAIIADEESAGEIVELSDGQERVLTCFAGEYCAESEPVTVTERVFASPDGREVHAFLLHRSPQSLPAPLLLDVHGGPHSAWSPAFDSARLYHRDLIALGWTILLVNPRGSDGYGEDFYRGVVGRMGAGDAQDLLEAVTVLVQEGVADTRRLGLTGYSYGGYMSCWLPTQTAIFGAAIAGGCVSDLRSMVGTADTGVDIALNEIGGHPWEVPDLYDASSPIAHASQVNTPTLLLQGEDDERCPIGQAEQWFTALYTLGIPTRLVRYPRASHGFLRNGRPSHRSNYCRELLAWLDLHLSARDGASATRAVGREQQAGSSPGG